MINILSYCAAANGETVLFLLFPASVAPNDKIKFFKKESDCALCRTKTSRKPVDGRDKICVICDLIFTKQPTYLTNFCSKKPTIFRILFKSNPAENKKKLVYNDNIIDSVVSLLCYHKPSPQVFNLELVLCWI